MFPEWTWIVGFWIGAAIGSFLNVVIYRMPRGLSLSKPEYSFCPSCRNRLTPIDLVPLLSWLFLGGKCRQCKAKIPARYFFVELVNASLWGAIWWQHLSSPETQGDATTAIAYSLFASALVAAIGTDLEHYIIPDQINAFMLVVGLSYGGVLLAQGRAEAWAWGTWAPLAGALVGIALIWGVAFLGLVAFRKDAMGHGDIKMMRGIGAMLFPFGVLGTFGIAIVLGAVLGALQVALRRKTAEEPDNSDSGPTEAPESIGSLVKCGLGYVLCVDVIGLFWTKLYEKWFGENPYSVEDIDDGWQATPSMIPFGPYLAAGALAVMVFGDPLRGLVEAYLRWTGLSGT